VIDDEESLRLLIARILESVPGVESTLTDGGAGTLELLAQRYDLILLDLLMPGVGGLEILRRIRDSGPNKATPVIVVSIVSDPQTKVVCQSLGVADYVVKPINREALARAVKAALP
jgi:CheY-like chemotaxis protein